MAKRKQEKEKMFMVWLGSLIFVFFLGSMITLAVAAPSGPPPSGSGVISANANGNVGIGLVGAAPTSKLTIGGTVESKSGGFKFPDATVQTSAAVAVVGVLQPAVTTTTAVGVAASCPSGQKVMSGGCQPSSFNCSLEASYPTATGWQCNWHNRKDATCLGSTNKAYVICY